MNRHLKLSLSFMAMSVACAVVGWTYDVTDYTFLPQWLLLAAAGVNLHWARKDQANEDS